MGKITSGMSYDLAREMVKAVNEGDVIHYGSFVTIEDCINAVPTMVVGGEDGYEVYTFQFGDLTILVWVLDFKVRSVKYVCW